MGGQFHSNGGEQNIAQGDHAIGSQTNNYGPVIKTTGDQAPAVNAQGDVTITYGVPFEKYEQVRDECERLKLEYGIRDAAFASFFRILNQENIPCAEWGAKLPEIALRYKELLLRFEAVISDDPQVQALKEQAKQAIENGDYDRADALLNQAKERDRAAIATLKASLAEQQAALEKRQLSEAQSCGEQGDLQRLQYRYEKSAQYLQEAAAALPEGHNVERADYLGAAGEDLFRIAHYADALRLYGHSIAMLREIGDRKQESKLLNNIGRIYLVQGEYGKAFDCLEKTLPMCQDVGDKECEIFTLNNIGMFYDAKGDYPNAMRYLEQSLLLCRKTNNKEGEGGYFNNIGTIHCKQGDYAAALECCNQALTISREIKDKQMESMALNNISQVYQAQGRHDEVLEYLEQSLAIARQTGDRKTNGITLNNIAGIYETKEDYATALKYFEQAIIIAKEIGDKNGEAVRNFNIGSTYEKQGELSKAYPYLSRAVELMEQLKHPKLKECRLELKMLRFMLWTWPGLFAWILRSLFRGRGKCS